MVDNISTSPCLICNANLNQKASFCHECGIEQNEDLFDKIDNTKQFADIINENFFEFQDWQTLEGYFQNTLRLRKKLFISYQQATKIFKSLLSYLEEKLPLSSFSLEFNRNINDAYAGHDTYLQFRFKNLSNEGDSYKIYIFWDDKETDDEDDLHIKSNVHIKPKESLEIGGTHIFMRAGTKEINELTITVTNQFKEEAIFKTSSFNFKVLTPNLSIINQITNKNEISIEGRGVVDASNLGGNQNNQQKKDDPEWAPLQHSLLAPKKKVSNYKSDKLESSSTIKDSVKPIESSPTNQTSKAPKGRESFMKEYELQNIENDLVPEFNNFFPLENKSLLETYQSPINLNDTTKWYGPTNEDMKPHGYGILLSQKNIINKLDIARYQGWMVNGIMNDTHAHIVFNSPLEVEEVKFSEYFGCIIGNKLNGHGKLFNKQNDKTIICVGSFLDNDFHGYFSFDHDASNFYLFLRGKFYKKFSYFDLIPTITQKNKFYSSENLISEDIFNRFDKNRNTSNNRKLKLGWLVLSSDRSEYLLHTEDGLEMLIHYDENTSSEYYGGTVSKGVFEKYDWYSSEDDLQIVGDELINGAWLSATYEKNHLSYCLQVGKRESWALKKGTEYENDYNGKNEFTLSTKNKN